tara:strand:- start:719 stop:883 length:165 start_codon:yes stop_codon:yes gene_type:complete
MDTLEDILYDAHHKGIKEEVILEYNKIQHNYPYNIKEGYMQAYINVVNKLKENE